MTDKRRSLKYYYLRLNGYEIVDLNRNGDNDLEDFVKLNLFTAHFSSPADLVAYLKEEGIISKNTEVESIEVVKRKKIVEDIVYYKYYLVSDSPLFSDELPYFSVRFVEDFFRINIQWYDAVREITEWHREILVSFINRVKKKNSKDSSNNNFLNNLYARLNNIDRINVLIKRWEKSNHMETEEYEKRVMDFVHDEILYMKGDVATTNFRGLAEMAKSIRNVLIMNHNLVIPEYKKVDYSKNTKRIMKPAVEEGEVDPDSYMFLEREDYTSLLGENPSDSQIESVENQILNHEERKPKIEEDEQEEKKSRL